MGICVCVFCIMLFCDGSNLATVRSLIRGALLNILKIVELLLLILYYYFYSTHSRNTGGANGALAPGAVQVGAQNE
jgi:hypothetical protein